MNCGVTIGMLVPSGRNGASYGQVSIGTSPFSERNATPNGEAPVSRQRTRSQSPSGRTTSDCSSSSSMPPQKLEVGVVEERARVGRTLALMDTAAAKLHSEVGQSALGGARIFNADEHVIDGQRHCTSPSS